MTPKELLERMTGIEDEFILSAAEEKSYKRSTAKYVRLAASLAACLAIAVGGIALGVQYMRQEPTIPPVTDPVGSAETDSAETETALPERSSDEDFVIDENGRLLAYTGTATEVYIPETVTEITANAFRQSEVADEIVKVHISSSVSYIDETAFAGLDAVEEFEVDAGNKVYKSKNGIIAADGFIFVGPNVRSGETIIELIEEFYGTDGGYNTSVGIDWATAVVQAYRRDNGPTEYFISDIIYATKSYRLEEEIPLNEKTRFLHGTNTFVIYNGDTLGGLNTVGDMWVTTDRSMYEPIVSSEIDLSENENYNKTVLVPTGEVEDNKFKYALFPVKFAVDQNNMGELLAYCVGTDEVVREEGYMTFKNGEIVLEPEETYTFKDLFDAEGILKGVRESEDFDEFRKTYAWEEDWAVSDILKNNAKKYKTYDRKNTGVEFNCRIDVDFNFGGTLKVIRLGDPAFFLKEKMYYLSETVVNMSTEFYEHQYIAFCEDRFKYTETAPRLWFELEISHEERDRCTMYATAVEIFGQKYTLDERYLMATYTEKEVEGYFCEMFCSVMLTPDAFLFIHTDPDTGEQTALLFTESGVTDLSDEAYTYGYDNFNERITYVSADGTESGYLTFKDGKAVYNAAEPENNSNRLKPAAVISE